MHMKQTKTLTEKPFGKIATVNMQKEIELPELEYFELDDVLLDDDALMNIKSEGWDD